jgi:hypothetical protein
VQLVFASCLVISILAVEKKNKMTANNNVGFQLEDAQKIKHIGVEIWKAELAKGKTMS